MQKTDGDGSFAVAPANREQPKAKEEDAIERCPHIFGHSVYYKQNWPRYNTCALVTHPLQKVDVMNFSGEI